jgi:hypothetical protein
MRAVYDLNYASEHASRTECDKVTRISGKLVSWPVLQKHLRELDGLVYYGSDSMLRKKLKEIVPEYVYAEQSTPDEVFVPSRLPGRESVLRIIDAQASW